MGIKMAWPVARIKGQANNGGTSKDRCFCKCKQKADNEVGD